MIYKANKSKFGRLDSQFRKVILKERTGDPQSEIQICDWCKCRKPCDISHVLDKGRYRKMRYVKENVLLLCRHCHQRWHDNPIDANKFLEELKGVEYYQGLKVQDRLTMYTPDLKMLALCFRQELRSLGL